MRANPIVKKCKIILIRYAIMPIVKLGFIMAGIGIVTVSHAASAATPQSNSAASAARDAGATSNSNQQAVISQIASQTASQRVADDEKRDVSTQRRAEAGFSSNQDEPHKDGDSEAEGSVGNEDKSAGSKLNLKI